MMYSHVGPERIDVAHVTEMVMRAGNGGIATFIGTVRDVADGCSVVGLEYSAYLEMAEKELARIVAEAVATNPDADIAAVHRIGDLAVGDVSIAIAAGHAHRGPAFDSCRYVIEEAKRRVPIWKRERYASGQSEWVIPTGAAAGSAAVPNGEG